MKKQTDIRYGEACNRCNASSGIDTCPIGGGKKCPIDLGGKLPKDYHKPRKKRKTRWSSK